MVKKIILSLIILFFQVTKNYAVELTITNDISNILNSKKICIRLSLNPQDQGIYSNSLNFSIDHPRISIASWECKQNPTMQYVARFKRAKKLYSQSLICEATLNFESDDKKTILQNLGESNLYISCIILDKNGISQPVSLAKALDDGFSLIGTGTYSNALNYENIKTFTQNYLNNSKLDDKKNIVNDQDYKKFHSQHKLEPEPSNIIIDNLKVIWGTLINSCKIFFMSLNYIILYLIIFILMILLSFKRLRSRNPWITEFQRLLGISWILWTCSFLNIFIQQYIFFTLFAILMTPISMYYIFTAKTESTLDKLKSFIGFALAMSILPLLVKAYLSFIVFQH
jgi:hypothetical protein